MNDATARQALQDPMKYYAALGLTKREVTEEEIKAAYRKTSRLVHPDRMEARLKNGAMVQTFEFDQTDVNEAYEVLSNIDLKRRYDQRSQHKYIRVEHDGMSIETEYHKDEFRARSPPVPCTITIGLTMVEAWNGSTKTFTINKDVLCEACEGQGEDPARSDDNPGKEAPKRLNCERCGGSGGILMFKDAPTKKNLLASNIEDARKRKRVSDERSTEEFEKLLKDKQDSAASYMDCPMCLGRGCIISVDDRCKECWGKGAVRKAVLVEDVRIAPARMGRKRYAHVVPKAGNESRGHEPSNLIITVMVSDEHTEPLIVRGERDQQRRVRYSLIGTSVFAEVDVHIQEFYEEAHSIALLDMEGNEVPIALTKIGSVQGTSLEDKGMLTGGEGSDRGQIHVGVNVVLPRLSKKQRRNVYGAFVNENNNNSMQILTSQEELDKSKFIKQYPC